MVRFQYHLITIIIIFVFLTLGIVLGISIGGDNLAIHQAQVIENLKQEIDEYKTDFSSLKKEANDMKTLVNRWENKGEEITAFLLAKGEENFEDKNFIFLAEENYIDEVIKFLSQWEIQTEVLKLEKINNNKRGEDKLLSYRDMHGDNKKFLIHEENKEIIKLLEANNLDFSTVEFKPGEAGNSSLKEIELIKNMFGIENLIDVLEWSNEQ